MHIRKATPSDNKELQALQARCPMGTSLVVSTVNTPDFFSRAKAYGWYKVYVACEGDEIIGSAAGAIHEALVGKELVKVGYEFQYFIAASHRRRGVARALHEKIETRFVQEGARLSYLVVMEGNAPAMGLFERLGFALHRTLVMPGLLVYREMEGNGRVVRPAREAELDRIARLRDETWKGFELYEPLTGEGLAQFVCRTPAFERENLLVLEENGEILACVGCWDWSQITSITVKAVSWKIRLMGTALKVAGWFRPMPSAVEPGDVLKQVVLTPVAFQDAVHLGALLSHVNNRCLRRGIGQIFCVYEKGDGLSESLGGFIHIDTDVHLYIKPLVPGLALGQGPVFLSGRDL